MKNVSEKIIFYDKAYHVDHNRAYDDIYVSESFIKKSKNKNFSNVFSINDSQIKTISNKTLYDSIFSDFDGGVDAIATDYTHNTQVSLKTLVNEKESDTIVVYNQLSISDNQSANEVTNEIHEFSQDFSISDESKTNDIETMDFSISDSVKIVEDNCVRQEISSMQKDYTEIKSNGVVYYFEGDKKYLAVGEVIEGVFKWYLNYNFIYDTEVKVEYSDTKEKKLRTHKFNSTQDLFLTYSKSDYFVESEKLSINLLPISLDGTPVKKIRIDLNQNFINPIQKKYNFNPLYINGNDYTINGNTLITHSNTSEVYGNIKLETYRYIKNISYNGKYSLPILSLDDLTKYDSLYVLNNNVTCTIIPYETYNSEYSYKLNNFNFSNGGIKGREVYWKLSGIGNYRNIILTFDNDNGVNYGNEINIEAISYRFDGYSGWKGTSLEGTYTEKINNVSGLIVVEDTNHVWGIGESDGIIEYSVDNITWNTSCRGLIGNELYFRSVGEISYLIVWKNNNKEIVYSTSGELELNTNEFGGICFNKNSQLRVSVDEGDWIDINDGNELSGLNIQKIKWDYTGNKLIFIKDLSDCITLETDDIENQGLHYGRIGVFINEGGIENCNFYRLLGVNDRQVDYISLNPLFSWQGKNEKYLVDFREVEQRTVGYECGKFGVDYKLNKLGKNEYYYIFDANGVGVNDIGFVEYREYSGNKEIKILDHEVIGVFLYDKNGGEVVLPYVIEDEKIMKFVCNDEFDIKECKVVVLYNVCNWSETLFRADLEKYDIEVAENAIVELNTVSKPLKAFLYNSLNDEIQFPVSIIGNVIKIDISNSDELMYNNLRRVVVIVEGGVDANGIICQKFNGLNSEVKTYYPPVASIYEGKFLPNKIISEDKSVVTDFPFYVQNSLQYVICEYNDFCRKNILSKIWVDTNRKFNSYNNQFKTYISSSDDLKFWEEWKEFNEEFDLCEYGRYFKLKTETIVIDDNNDEKISGINFAFENLYMVKRDLSNNEDKIYFSPLKELNKNTLYMIRVKSYNGTNYSEWSNAECYLTDENDLILSAENLFVEGNKERVVKEINFSWVGEQNVLTYDNMTLLNEKSKTDDGLIKGKDYVWQVKDERSKNTESNFSINIKPPTPTFND